VNLHCVTNGPFQENTWVVGDGAGTGIVVDPGFELDRVVRAIEEAGLTIAMIVNTHGHIDHASGVAELKERLGVPFALHPEDRFILEHLPTQSRMFGLPEPAVPEIEHELVDGEDLVVGELTLRVVHTPGHTPGGCCFLADGHAVTGDSLFAGSIGRTDLPGGSWEVYQRTIRDTILSWPDETKIHPGHGPDSTMAVERQTNPFLVDQM
jgi:glyoxylase-like metal-dependent hydrolase (beta-lactamase superfamily II)